MSAVSTLRFPKEEATQFEELATIAFSRGKLFGRAGLDSLVVPKPCSLSAVTSRYSF